MPLTDKQQALARAIYYDFGLTYPGVTLQMVMEEMESQIAGNSPKKGILGLWIQDYLQEVPLMSGADPL